MRPHTKINTYHHRLKENPAPTPLVHDPPAQKIGWNLKAQVWIVGPENERQPQRQSWWRSPGVSSHWGLQSSSSIHYTPRKSRKWKWKIFAKYYTLSIFEPILRRLKKIFSNGTKCKIRFIYVGFNCKWKKWGKKMSGNFAIKGGGSDA